MADSRTKRGFAPWRVGAVVQEVVSHAALLAIAWYGGLGYIGLMMVLAAEMLLGNLVSTAVYPERGVLRHLFDLVKFGALMAFLLFFVVVTYGAAMQDELTGPAADSPFGLFQFDAGLVRWTLGFTIVHLGVMMLLARRRPEPRLEWARSVLAQNAVTFFAVFAMIFVAAFLGPFATNAVRAVDPTASGDAVLSFLLVGVRFAIALLMSRMPEDELREIARQPYVD